MKKLILPLLATMLLTSTTALASFAGLWSGRGQVSDISGAKLDCEKIQFKVEQNEISLKILEGYIMCRPQELRVNDMKMTIQNGNLIKDGDKIGTITNDAIRLSYINKDGLRVRSTGKLKDTILQYQEEWLDQEGNRLLIFRGQLSRK